jgi:hypothetical protein
MSMNPNKAKTSAYLTVDGIATRALGPAENLVDCYFFG